MDEEDDNNIEEAGLGEEPSARGELGKKAGGMAGAAIGGYFGGPIGSMVGKYIGEKLGDKAEDKIKEEIKEQMGGSSGQSEPPKEEQQKKKGGSCGGDSGGAGVGDYSASDGQCHSNPKTPLYKLEIEKNDYPENWWDQLPDFDPRVYDAIAMEQAAACVDYIFEGLPDMHDLENKLQAKGFPKICPRLKTQVPRTKIIMPKEIIYDTTMDSFIKKDQTY